MKGNAARARRNTPYTAPTDPSQYTFIRRNTKAIFNDTFASALAGQGVYYIARWEIETGDTGPWSDPASAKILG